MMKRVFRINDEIDFILSEKKIVRLNDGYSFKLRAPASFCLVLLMENQGELVSHSELFQQGWEQFRMTASLNVLHNTIFYLRKTLSDFGGFDSGIIETIPRRGFIFSRKVVVEIHFIKEISAFEIFDKEAYNKVKNEPEIDKANLHASGISDIDVNNESKGLNLTSKNQSCIQEPYIKQGHDESINSCSIELDSKINKHSGLENIKPTTPILAILGILILLMLWLTLHSYSYKYSFTQDYLYVGELDKCKIYQNNLQYKFNELNINEPLKSFCARDSYLYITHYLYSDHISVINCLNEFSLLSNDNCTSSYFIYDEKK